MKKVKLGSLEDAAVFYLNPRSKVTYKVNKKYKGKVAFSSQKSEYTYSKPASTTAYQPK